MKLTVASSPHIRGNFRTNRIMLDVVLALIPGLLMGIITLLPLIVFFIDLQLFVYVFILWQFAGFSLSAKINSKICMFVFSALDPPEDSADSSEELTD